MCVGRGRCGLSVRNLNNDKVLPATHRVPFSNSVETEMSQPKPGRGTCWFDILISPGTVHKNENDGENKSDKFSSGLGKM